MELHPRLIADLALLTTALDTDDVDLEHLARRLMADIDDAVSSVVSVAITITIDGAHFVIASSTTDESAGATVSSLRLTLARPTNAHSSVELLILSATAGALVDLAADVNYSLGLDRAAITLDGHAREIDESNVIATEVENSFTAVSEINQAVGVLIEGGRTSAEGRAEMNRLALLSGTPVIEVARRVLRDARRWHPPRR
ncbi:hypothetical protein QMK17_16025 [Rhodococcus sp. G-MC3]|uniref:hypothetical protein n=1 Tax=Rhodococcus sp. G-MC3 TaxID=3046209 RepID=UPI0024B96D24|nr:hypothetical protein [Rhodococcus sp. G-MC3]MDJ0394832.1 hypothetical protein [Rhodococcus sp. G-MC3]